jgi:hypothetical protein
MSFDRLPFEFLPAFGQWLLVVGVLSALAGGLSLVFAVVLHGAAGPAVAWRVACEGVTDFVRMSPRRIWALTVLTMKESLRRRVLLIFIVFVVLFMFAGWFMGDSDMRPDLQIRNLVSFVLRAISWLILPLVLLLSCWGLPEDIRARSLHTVVTKPVRRSEIVLGRIFGFVLVGSGVLLAMGVVGYVWIVRQVPEKAQSQLVSRVPVLGEMSFLDSNGNPSNKGINVGDMWEYRSYIEGLTAARAIWTFDGVDAARLGDKLTLESNFEAFRTHKGKDMDQSLLVQYIFVKDLKQRIVRPFKTSADFQLAASHMEAGDYAKVATELDVIADGIGKLKVKVPKESRQRFADVLEREYTSVFEPFTQTHSSAKWPAEFQARTRELVAATRAGNQKPLAKALRALGKAFKSHAAVLKKEIVDVSVEMSPFEIAEFKGNKQVFKRKLPPASIGAPQLDLFDDLVHGGRLRVEVRGLERGQYLGMARPDLFIRLPDRPFLSGFSKAILANWLMMVLITVIGVTASCFLKGPIAAVLTFSLIIMGTVFHDFMDRLVHDKVPGAGAVESVFRIGTHKNQSVKLDDSIGKSIMQAIDKPLLAALWLVFHVIPNFNPYEVTGWVANGFDVPWSSAMMTCLFNTLAYFLPCSVLGYFMLRLRELESK